MQSNGSKWLGEDIICSNTVLANKCNEALSDYDAIACKEAGCTSIRDPCEDCCNPGNDYARLFSCPSFCSLKNCPTAPAPAPAAEASQEAAAAASPAAASTAAASTAASTAAASPAAAAAAAAPPVTERFRSNNGVPTPYTNAHAEPTRGGNISGWNNINYWTNSCMKLQTN